MTKCTSMVIFDSHHEFEALFVAVSTCILCTELSSMEKTPFALMKPSWNHTQIVLSYSKDEASNYIQFKDHF